MNKKGLAWNSLLLGSGPATSQRGEVSLETHRKRLSLCLDGETYCALRMRAVETGNTHQNMMEAAVRAWLGLSSLNRNL